MTDTRTTNCGLAEGTLATYAGRLVRVVADQMENQVDGAVFVLGLDSDADSFSETFCVLAADLDDVDQSYAY